MIVTYGVPGTNLYQRTKAKQAVYEPIYIIVQGDRAVEDIRSCNLLKISCENFDQRAYFRRISLGESKLLGKNFFGQLVKVIVYTS